MYIKAVVLMGTVGSLLRISVDPQQRHLQLQLQQQVSILSGLAGDFVNRDVLVMVYIFEANVSMPYFTLLENIGRTMSYQSHIQLCL